MLFGQPGTQYVQLIPPALVQEHFTLSQLSPRMNSRAERISAVKMLKVF
jgi:hypothetical protein